MIVGRLRRDPAARCPGQETDLHEVRLVDVLNRGAFFGNGRRNRIDADRAAAEFLNDSR